MKTLAYIGAAAVVSTVLVAGMHIGCGPLLQECTEAGCDDELRISIKDADDNPVNTFEGEVKFDGESVEFLCDPDEGSVTGEGYHCNNDVLVLMEHPEQLELTISSGELSAETTLTPEYEEYHPNGPGCPPTCHQAEEAVVLQ